MIMNKDNMGWMCCVSFILLIVGGLNWGLIGLFDFNLVAMLFGKIAILERIIYILVGVAAVYGLIQLINKCSKGGCCNKGNNAT